MTESMGDDKRDGPVASEQYSLLVETETSDMQGAYNDDSTVARADSAVGGHLVVYVNDSPARLHCRGSGLFPIFDLLQPGSNTVRIDGRHLSRIFIKVLILDQRRFLGQAKANKIAPNRVVAKTWLDPTKNSVTLHFEAAVPKVPDWEELPGWPKSEEKLRVELGDLVDKWIGWCNDHDLDALSRSWMPDLKKAPLYLRPRDAANQTLRAGNDPITNRKYRLLTRAGDVKAVFGKRTVILFAGLSEGSLPYLFRFSSAGGHDACYVGAITLGRLEGHWVVQHIMR